MYDKQIYAPFNREIFKTRLRECFDNSGFTLPQIAEITGVPLAALQRYLKGVLPSVIYFARIRYGLSLDGNYLLQTGTYLIKKEK